MSTKRKTSSKGTTKKPDMFIFDNSPQLSFDETNALFVEIHAFKNFATEKQSKILRSLHGYFSKNRMLTKKQERLLLYLRKSIVVVKF